MRDMARARTSVLVMQELFTRPTFATVLLIVLQREQRLPGGSLLVVVHNKCKTGNDANNAEGVRAGFFEASRGAGADEDGGEDRAGGGLNRGVRQHLARLSEFPMILRWKQLRRRA